MWEAVQDRYRAFLGKIDEEGCSELDRTLCEKLLVLSIRVGKRATCDAERGIRAVHGSASVLRRLRDSHQIHLVSEGVEGSGRLEAERAAGNRRGAAAAALRRDVPLRPGDRRRLQVQHRAAVQAADGDRGEGRARHGGVSGEVQRGLSERVPAELFGVVRAAVREEIEWNVAPTTPPMAL